jgi:hypothetical protein
VLQICRLNASFFCLVLGIIYMRLSVLYVSCACLSVGGRMLSMRGLDMYPPHDHGCCLCVVLSCVVFSSSLLSLCRGSYVSYLCVCLCVCVYVRLLVRVTVCPRARPFPRTFMCPACCFFSLLRSCFFPRFSARVPCLFRTRSQMAAGEAEVCQTCVFPHVFVYMHVTWC